MSCEEFIKMVEKMRIAQKTYFATRESSWLSESKRLERLVDRAIASKEIGQGLFDGLDAK